MKGLITRAVGGFFFLADAEQQIHQTGIRGKVKERIYPGDLVEYREGMVEGVYPRKNLLQRPNIANVDQVLIVQSAEQPPLDRKLLDRFLVMVEYLSLEAVIVINKIDLEEGDIASLERKLEDYRRFYQVFLLSVKEKRGFESLAKALYHRINVLTGPSGVGKSSLINILVHEAEMAVGEISVRLKRGMHKTRHVELLPTEMGGWIADTPGFTSLDIKHIPLSSLKFCFPEFDSSVEECRFRGCSHTHEPGCAVKGAVEAGKISVDRYRSYLSLYQELNQQSRY